MLSTTERIGQKAKDTIDLTVQLAWQAGYDQAVKDMEEIEHDIIHSFSLPCVDMIGQHDV